MLTTPTAYAISGRVDIIAYINDPQAEAWDGLHFFLFPLYFWDNVLLKALHVIEEALKMALHQSSEIFPIPSQCTSLGTQIVLLKNVLSFSKIFHRKCRFEFAF